jgi:hypothetical protein
MSTRDDSLVFSDNQAITISAASNNPRTGFGSFAAGVLDTGGPNSIGDQVKKSILKVTVGVPFVGPAGSTLTAFLQESSDGTTWFNTDLGNSIVNSLAMLQQAGIVLLDGVLPRSGNSPATSISPIGRLGQYLRCFYTVGGGPFTAGTLNAWIEVW